MQADEALRAAARLGQALDRQRGSRAREDRAVVEDLDPIIAAVEANGGRITMPKAPIPTVGVLIRFEDPEGNDIGAMAYEQRPVTR